MREASCFAAHEINDATGRIAAMDRHAPCHSRARTGGKGRSPAVSHGASGTASDLGSRRLTRYVKHASKQRVTGGSPPPTRRARRRRPSRRPETYGEPPDSAATAAEPALQILEGKPCCVAHASRCVTSTGSGSIRDASSASSGHPAWHSMSMTPCLLYWSMAIIKPLPRRDVAAAQVQAGGCGLERSVWVVHGAWAGLVSQALASARGSRDAATGEAGVVAG